MNERGALPRSSSSSSSSSSSGMMTKFQRIKLAVAKRPMYRGERAGSIRKRVEEQRMRLEKKGDLSNVVREALGEEGSERLRILQTLSKEGIVEKYKRNRGEGKQSIKYVVDDETGKQVCLNRRTKTRFQSNVEDLSALETLMEDISSKLRSTGELLERKKVDKDGYPISTVHRSFAQQTKCHDPAVGQFYLDHSGWCPSHAAEKYFRCGGQVPDEKIITRQDRFDTLESTLEKDLDEEDRKSSTDDLLLSVHAVDESERRGGVTDGLASDRIMRHLKKIQIPARSFETILSDMQRERSLRCRKTDRVTTTSSLLSTSKPSTAEQRKVPVYRTLPDHYMKRNEPLKSLQAMRQNHNMQLSVLIESEDLNEQKRRAQLVRVRSHRERERLKRKFERERRQARSLIENVRKDNEAALAAKMVALGVVR
eukprot:g440.t1